MLLKETLTLVPKGTYTCLNPCCNGMLLKVKSIALRYLIQSLNPCCNGMLLKGTLNNNDIKI